MHRTRPTRLIHRSGGRAAEGRPIDRKRKAVAEADYVLPPTSGRRKRALSDDADEETHVGRAQRSKRSRGDGVRASESRRDVGAARAWGRPVERLAHASDAADEASGAFAGVVTKMEQMLLSAGRSWDRTPRVAGASDDREDSANLRLLLKEVLIASEAEPEARADALRYALAAHPELVEWFIQLRDLRAMCVDAGLPDQEFSPDLPLLEPFPGVSVDVSKLSVGLYDQVTRFQSKTRARHPLVRRLTGLVTYESRLRALRMVPDFALEAMLDEVDALFDQISLCDQPEVQILRDPVDGIDFSEIPRRIQVLFDDIVMRYFDTLPLSERKAIACSLLSLPPEATLAEKLATLLLNHCGPALQKVFQLLGKNSKSALITDTLKCLYEKIPAMPFREVRGIVREALGKEIEEAFVDFDPRPLGAATVCQTHRAVIRGHDGQNRQVAVKVMRNGAGEHAAREFDQFMALTDDPFAHEVLEDLRVQTQREFDFRLEARNLEFGVVYDLPGDGIKAIKRAPEIPATKTVFAMEFAPGKSLDAYTDVHLRAFGVGPVEFLQIKGDAVSRLMKRWFQNAIFGDGFIHADLHPGNIFFDLLRRILVLIDFGSVAKIPPEMQRAVKIIGTGVSFGSYRIVAMGIRRLVDMKPEQEAAFQVDVCQALAGPEALMTKIFTVFKLTIRHGMKLPGPIMQFNRGHFFLESQLREINAELEQQDPLQTVPRFDPDEIYKWATMESIYKRAEPYVTYLGVPLTALVFA